jgi:predicted enzyme related to lactoylglutathione lyase
MAIANIGRFVWHEHMTNDVKAAIAFYGEVVGWKTQPFGKGSDYTMWVGSQGPLGGVMTLPEKAKQMGAPPHWIGNVVVEDVKATAALVTKLGGKIVHGPETVPEVGSFVVLADPHGAVINAFQPSGPMSPHDASKEGEFCWNELITSDREAALKFYSQVFGWKSIDKMDMGPMGTYELYGVDGTTLGGMMNLPKGMTMPPSWLYYTETSNLDAAVARATKLGAKVMSTMDVPQGRIAQLMDPQGAAFALHQLTAKK